MRDKLETALFITLLVLVGLGAIGRAVLNDLRKAITELPYVWIWIAFTSGLLAGYLGG